MIVDPGESASYIFPPIDSRQPTKMIRLTPIFKENRQQKLKILRQMIHSGEYCPRGYAIADAIVFGNFGGAAVNGPACASC